VFDEKTMDFEIVSEISSVQTIATGPSIRDLIRLIKAYIRPRTLAKEERICRGTVD